MTPFCHSCYPHRRCQPLHPYPPRNPGSAAVHSHDRLPSHLLPSLKQNVAQPIIRQDTLQVRFILLNTRDDKNSHCTNFTSNIFWHIRTGYTRHFSISGAIMKPRRSDLKTKRKKKKLTVDERKTKKMTQHPPPTCRQATVSIFFLFFRFYSHRNSRSGFTIVYFL